MIASVIILVELDFMTLSLEAGGTSPRGHTKKLCEWRLMSVDQASRQQISPQRLDQG